MGENMAEEMENEDTVLKNKRARKAANQRRYRKDLQERAAQSFAEACENGTDVMLTASNYKDGQYLKASEIKEWGLSNMPELRPAKKGEPGYYADKIL